MRVILLAGGPADRDTSCPQGLPRPFWPVMIRPMVLRTIDHLARTGVDAMSVCANGRTALYADRLAREPLELEQLHFSQDPLPRGPAGCIKDNQSFIGGDSFLVVGAACWMSDPASWLIERHRQQHNTLTVFTLPGTQSPSGVYACEPEVLEHIPPAGYVDIKEQLIPRLIQKGLRVGALPLRALAGEVLGVRSYLFMHRRVLTEDLEHEATHLDADYNQPAPQTWVATNAFVSPRARLFGPVVVGPHARIEDDAIVIGPTTVGVRAEIAGGAVVTECAVWPEASVSESSTVSRSLVVGRARSSTPARRHTTHDTPAFAAAQESTTYV